MGREWYAHPAGGVPAVPLWRMVAPAVVAVAVAAAVAHLLPCNQLHNGHI